MPDRCDRRCSTVTPSSITGRSLPRTERAGVESSSTLSSIRLTTASAVKPFAPLASPKRVSTAFGISKPRCARPYALASSIRSLWSIRTTPENPVPDARASSSPPRSDMRQTLAGACIRPPSARAHPAALFPFWWHSRTLAQPGVLPLTTDKRLPPDCPQRAVRPRRLLLGWPGSSRRCLLGPGAPRREGPVLVTRGWPGLGAAAEAAARTTSQPLAGKPDRSPTSNRPYLSSRIRPKERLVPAPEPRENHSGPG